MQSIGDISQEYFDMIKKVESQVQEYEDYIISLQKKLGSLSEGNYGIDEIKEEIVTMKSTISKMQSECVWIRNTIAQNESKY